MKKLLIALLFSTTAFAQDITPQQVLEKYFTAIGGRDAIAKIDDITTDIETEAMGQTYQFQFIRKRPNKLILIQKLNGEEASKTIFDGVKGKVSAQGQEFPIEGEQAKLLEGQAVVINELGYFAEGVKLSSLPKETINGEECNVIQVELGTNTFKEYYSVASGLKLRQDTQAQGMDVVTYYNNYKEFSPGIKFAVDMKQEVMGGEMETTITSIKINTGINDSEFVIK